MDDLEKVRDEKCLPIIKVLFKEVATDLTTATDNHDGLVMKSLSIMLEKDLNIATEVSYVPQIILRTLAEMNSTFQSVDVIPEDTERYNRIASQILMIISDADIDMGDITPEDAIKQFEPIKEKFNELFAKENLTKLELVYIKDIIFDKFTEFNNKLSASIQMATEKAESKALGVDSMFDLTLKKLDEFLKS